MITNTIKFYCKGKLIGQSAFVVRRRTDVDSLIARGKRIACDNMDVTENMITCEIVDEQGNDVAEQTNAA